MNGRDLADPELRDVIDRLVARGVGKVLRFDDGLHGAFDWRRPGRDRIEVDLADVRVLRKHRLLGIDLRSLPIR